MNRAAMLAAVLVSGCSRLAATGLVCGPAGRGPPGRATDVLPPGGLSVSSALAGASEVEAKFVDLPPVSGWPRPLRAKGPVYALVEFHPYVGQLGVLSETRRADAGTGFGIVAGYRLPMANAKTLGFELNYEWSDHTNEAAGGGVDATAKRVVAAARLNMRMDEKLTPFAVAGAGIYKLEFDGMDPTYNLSGLGVMMGGGVDYSPSPSFSIRAELGLHIWAAGEEASDHGGTAETLTLGLGAAVSF